MLCASRSENFYVRSLWCLWFICFHRKYWESSVQFSSVDPPARIAAVSKSIMLCVDKSDAHFQAALVLAERTFDKAWGEEETKAAALTERKALELELQVAELEYS